MNMMKLRQILEMRRATKAPPLIPPRTKRSVIKKGGFGKLNSSDQFFKIKICNFNLTL